MMGHKLGPNLSCCCEVGTCTAYTIKCETVSNHLKYNVVSYECIQVESPTCSFLFLCYNWLEMSQCAIMITQKRLEHVDVILYLNPSFLL